MDKNAVIKKKTPAQKLIDRINREFKKCKYIGDIRVNDEEYHTLIKILKNIYHRIEITDSHVVTSSTLAVALVQIGIHHYDGRFWKYVGELLEIKLTAKEQGWIGRSFYETLKRHNKIHTTESEMVNNILMHCFITEHYAEDLFDFLLMYYQIDLDRDLARNTKEMRDTLMSSLKKGEKSSRAYKIKKHTSDAVSANEHGCKIRVARILKLIDNALFNDVLPENSQNRISQLFVKWAKSSKKFGYAKNSVKGLNKHGIKRFSAPYIRFDVESKNFKLVLPSQNIALEENEIAPNILWKISIGEKIENLEVEYRDSVIGCKTDTVEILLADGQEIFEKIRIELWKNNVERVKIFDIKSETVRFFDKDWDLVQNLEYLPNGTVFAFSNFDERIISESLVDEQIFKGLRLYNFCFTKGDVVVLPNGKIKSIGNQLTEGLLTHGKVNGAYVLTEEKYVIYKKAPSILFTATSAQEKGICIYVNEKPHRFDASANDVIVSKNVNSEKNGYILNLSSFVTEPGAYEICVDVPNDRRILRYKFSYIPNFEFAFIDAPYIFKEQGEIVFADSLNLCGESHIKEISKNRYRFDIDPDEDFLTFVYTEKKNIKIRIYIPVFKWKFDHEEWCVDQPYEIWHKEFPKKIYLKFPDDVAEFSMPPILFDNSEEEEEIDFCACFNKDKEEHLFECDTRKMFSWFGFEEAFRPLKINFKDVEINFALVVTRNVLVGCKIEEKREKDQLIIRNDIVGLAECVADVFFNDVMIKEKEVVTTGGIKLKIPSASGTFRVIFYEQEDDDFGFEDYRKFDERKLKFENAIGIGNKSSRITGIVENTRNTFFSPEKHIVLGDAFFENVSMFADQSGFYVADLRISDRVIVKVKIKFISKSKILFTSNEDIAYNKIDRTLQVVSKAEIKENNWILCNGDNYLLMIETN